jgi:C4-type Zn-finger protein
MGKYEIKVKVEIVESSKQNAHEPQEQNDGSFTMIIDDKDAVSIDHSEKALLKTAYPTIRKALSKHLENVSKKKPLRSPKHNKSS